MRCKKMKRNLLKILFIVIIGLTVSGCSLENLSPIKEIEYKQLKEKINNKETFILEVIQTGCSHCEEFSPRLKSILNDNHLTAFSINLKNLSDDERKELNDITTIKGTPTVVFFQKGQDQTAHKIVGAVSNKIVTGHLKDLGYIK